MKLARRGRANEVQKPPRSEKAAPATKKKSARAPAEVFDAGAKTNHARKLDGDNATKARIPQASLYGAGEDRAGQLRARVDAGVLNAIDAPKGLHGEGLSIGPEGYFQGKPITERRAFEAGGKVYVHATVLYTPGHQWFEVGAPPPPPKPDPAIALRERMREKVDARTLVPLDKAPKGLHGEGLSIGPEGYFQGKPITERRAFEAGGKVYVHATVLYTPGHQWFEAKTKA